MKSRDGITFALDDDDVHISVNEVSQVNIRDLAEAAVLCAWFGIRPARMDLAPVSDFTICFQRRVRACQRAVRRYRDSCAEREMAELLEEVMVGEMLTRVMVAAFSAGDQTRFQRTLAHQLAETDRNLSSEVEANCAEMNVSLRRTIALARLQRRINDWSEMLEGAFRSNGCHGTERICRGHFHERERCLVSLDLSAIQRLTPNRTIDDPARAAAHAEILRCVLLLFPNPAFDDGVEVAGLRDHASLQGLAHYAGYPSIVLDDRKPGDFRTFSGINGTNI